MYWFPQYLDTLLEITTLQISVFCPFTTRITLYRIKLELSTFQEFYCTVNSKRASPLVWVVVCSHSAHLPWEVTGGEFFNTEYYISSSFKRRNSYSYYHKQLDTTLNCWRFYCKNRGKYLGQMPREEVRGLGWDMGKPGIDWAIRMNIAKKATELHLKRFFTNITFIYLLILIPDTLN